MSYNLIDKDYLELWGHFQEKADNIKEAMFKTITWIMGFASALLGFIFLILTDYDCSKASISPRTLVLSLSTAGLVICLYAFLSIAESAKHIKSNWEYANNCYSNINNFHNIVTLKANIDKPNILKNWLSKIWNQLGIIVALFSLGFAVVLISSIYCLQDGNCNQTPSSC